MPLLCFALILALAIFNCAHSQKLIKPAPVPVEPATTDASSTNPEPTPITETTVETTTPAPYVPEEIITIVGADTVVPNTYYTIAVSLYNSNVSAKFRVGVRSTNGSEDFYKTVKALPWRTVRVQVTIPLNLVSTSFELYANNTDGIFPFGSSKPLLISEKKYATFVQTDKATYKPGDLVQFRVVTLNRYLKPTRSKPLVQVYINDNDGNRLKQWNNVTLRTGVYKNKYQLNSQTSLGTWSIDVDDGYNFVTKNFIVDDYVLPKFAVNIVSKRNIALSDSTLSVLVGAKYTFGQNVRGTYNITASRTSYISASDSVQTVQRNDVACTSQNVETFNLANDLGVTSDCDIIVNVTFTETLTGNTQSAEYTVSVHVINYQISITGNNNYNPGLTYRLYATVTNFDGEPILDTTNKVEFYVQNQIYWFFLIRRPGPISPENTSTYNETEYVTLDNNGIAHVEFTLPSGYNNFQITATYLNASSSLTISKASSSTNEYIQVNVMTKNPKIAQPVSPPVSVLVETTAAIKYLTWQITSGNSILDANTVTINPPSSCNTISFVPTFSMAPTAKLLVSYISEINGNIICEVTDINFAVTFQNDVTIDVSVPETTPGTNVTFTVKTAPSSYCGLLGVDQKVLLLRTGNDLDPNEITGSITTYDTENQYDVYDSSYSKFSDDRTVILTNTPESSGDSSQIFFPLFLARAPVEEAAAAPVPGPAPAPAPAPPSTATVVFRTIFPETWFYDDITSFSSTGTQKFNKTVPDDITKWIINGFCLSYTAGFGMTQSPTELNAFYKFFVSLQLPYSIVRGEIIAISLVVFNYQNFDVNATVTMFNSKNEFDFIGLVPSADQSSLTKTISIAENDGTSLSFLIRPKVVGSITIKIAAVTTNAGDGVEQLLLVKPEGVTQTVCNSHLIDLRNVTSFNATDLINVPVNAVTDSTNVKISIVGEVLGSVIKNLDNLIQMPYGCGEQNMINFVPDIAVLDYLTITDKLTSNIKTNAINYMEQGYQRELTYMHPNGGYSAFGDSGGANASTWLTAFVIRSFVEGEVYITIDQNVISQGFSFLVSTQNPDGSFQENGFIIHTDLKGGESGELGLTCYVLLAFLSTPAYQSTYQTVIASAFNYIITSLDNGNDDLYSLALANYALQTAQHPDRARFLARLQSKATSSGGFVFWQNPVQSTTENDYLYGQPNSFNVELTAYCLLTYLKAGLILESMPVAKWIISQQNVDGGFQSTQDTVMGITSLGKYAATISGGTLNQKLVVRYPGWKLTYSVTKANAQVLQQRQLPPTTDKVSVTATGSGSSIYQVCYSYNIMDVAIYPRFTIIAIVSNDSTAINLNLQVCVAFIPDTNNTKSNMALLQITLPSGYTATTDELMNDPDLVGSNHVSNVQTQNGDTIIIIYFEYLDASQTCIEVDATLTTNVADQKPSSITIVDYYDTTRKASIFYEPPSLTQCDICDGDDCDALNCN